MQRPLSALLLTTLCNPSFEFHPSFKKRPPGAFFSTEKDDEWTHQVHRLLPKVDDDVALPDEPESGESIGQAIARGKVILEVSPAASTEECQTMVQAALNLCDDATDERGRRRFSVSSNFDKDFVLTVEDILLDVMDYLDEAVPSIYQTLFAPHDDWLTYQPLNAQLEAPTVPPESYLQDTCETLGELYQDNQLEWSEGEPAINVYKKSGYFGAHKDHLALTILIPLTTSFEGGGTGFWAGNRNVDENVSTPPDLILKSPTGSALVFGGDVTHAGMPVLQGLRSVLVCSFSTRTPTSRPDRLHGLRDTATVSPNFKGIL